VSLIRRLQVIIEALRSRSRQDNRAHAFLEGSRFVSGLIFVFTVFSILLISYGGLNRAHLPVLQGQVASVSIQAAMPFSFVSQEQTRLMGERIRARIPPVYRLDDTPLHQFEAHLQGLLLDMEAFERNFPPNTPSFASRKQALSELVERFNRKGPYRSSSEDIATFLASGDAESRRALAQRCLVVLSEIYREGTRDQLLAADEDKPGSVTVFQIVNKDGEVMQRPVLSLEEALIFLRVNLTAEGMQRELATALFRVFRNGLVPNLIFDKVATDKREAAVTRTVPPVTVHVEKGQTIVEAGNPVTKEQYEMLVAERELLQQQEGDMGDESIHLFSRILMVLAMVAASLMYIRLEDPDTLHSNGRLALLASVVIINLALVRLTYSLLGTDFFVHETGWAATLPYFAPTALAPIIVAILIDAGSAIFMALFISLFAGVIYGNRFDVQVVTFLASIVAINGCRYLRQRGTVVRAATAGGFVLALTTLLLGLSSQTPTTVLIRQMGAGLLTGILTGVTVLGVLPILEALFRRTTNITLLELTDFNHPLLRTMQMETPGTYHHSLVVAQLSENAAAVVDGNPLLARVCALYHDIGKTRNPEFFSENQSPTRNPHDNTPPELSADIIRRHVSDGVELARRHHLPRAVIEVIEQHHGTTLIRFFHAKARQHSGPDVHIDERLYRYEGPRPRFKESAVIALADTVEAASRSLKQFDYEHLVQLIDTVVAERLADHQLDEAPLTLAEIAAVKGSFADTLINMLHSRIAYPKE
jgi:putative nucleotidyltransferase with HDIG domain